ncbi:hypothetical protein ACFX2J_032879 [Malus domestica]
MSKIKKTKNKIKISITFPYILKRLISTTSDQKAIKRSVVKREERRREEYGVLGVLGEPDGGEMAPTELGLNDIPSALESVTDSNGVVAVASVVLCAFVLRRVVVALTPIEIFHGKIKKTNLEMQRLREKIEIEPGDAAATGEDEEEDYGKR